MSHYCEYLRGDEPCGKLAVVHKKVADWPVSKHESRRENAIL